MKHLSRIFKKLTKKTSKVFMETPFVELIEADVGFVVSIDSAVSKDISFDWWIVETN